MQKISLLLICVVVICFARQKTDSLTVTGGADIIRARIGTITDDVSVIGIVSSEGIELNKGSVLDTYLDTLFEDSLYDGDTFRATGSVRIIQVGKLVTMWHGGFTGNINSSYTVSIRGVPAKFRSFQGTYCTIPIITSSTKEIGVMYCSTTGFEILRASLANLGEGTGGISGCVVSFFVN